MIILNYFQATIITVFVIKSEDIFVSKMAKIPADVLAEYEGDIDLTGIDNFNSSFTKECFICKFTMQSAMLNFSIGLKAHPSLNNTQN